MVRKREKKPLRESFLDILNICQMVTEWADATWDTGTGCSVWSAGKSFLFSVFLPFIISNS